MDTFWIMYWFLLGFHTLWAAVAESHIFFPEKDSGQRHLLVCILIVAAGPISFITVCGIVWLDRKTGGDNLWEILTRKRKWWFQKDCRKPESTFAEGDLLCLDAKGNLCAGYTDDTQLIGVTISRGTDHTWYIDTSGCPEPLPVVEEIEKTDLDGTDFCRTPVFDPESMVKPLLLLRRAYFQMQGPACTKHIYKSNFPETDTDTVLYGYECREAYEWVFYYYGREIHISKIGQKKAEELLKNNLLSCPDGIYIPADPDIDYDHQGTLYHYCLDKTEQEY